MQAYTRSIAYDPEGAYLASVNADGSLNVWDLANGKQQLSREHVGILKNDLTLAFYNVGTGVQLQLGLKERGGRKK